MKTRFILFITVISLVLIKAAALHAQTSAPTPDVNPESNTGALKAQVTTGGSYDAHSGNMTRTVTDLHVPGALGLYGLDFTRYWNSIHNEDDNLAAHWPLDFGGGWSHSWRWAAEYDEELSPCEDGNCQHRDWTTSITITFPDGHATKFKIVRRNYTYGGGSPDPRFGPPYRQPPPPPNFPQERNWPSPGLHVHDNLVDMEEDGSQFWLNRADGGAVHFGKVSYPDGRWEYLADKVFDPNGFRNDLEYTNGYLTKVTQETGDRWLSITWGIPSEWLGAVITKVETGGDAGSHTVRYNYRAFFNGGAHMLATVGYLDDPPPGPGQIASAIYTYTDRLGLLTADDPHYMGAMTRIKYEYRDVACARPDHTPVPPLPPDFYDWFYFSPDAIAVEKSADTDILVSSFESSCPPPNPGPFPVGERHEKNGIGGMRKLFYGRSAGDPEISAMGYDLTKVTDFAPENANFAAVPSRKGRGPEPQNVWDGRGIRTGLEYRDDSGQPSDVHNVEADGSSYHYERIDPNGSDSVDTDRIHNTQRVWLFSKTDELGHTTRYIRDYRRRIKRIEYADGSLETYTYDDSSNQVATHTLPSGAVWHYEYDPKHRLMLEWNSVDRGLNNNDFKSYTYYGINNHPEWADLVETVTDGRARANGTFTAKMTYNGRGQVTSVEYPSTGEPGEAPNPTVRYEYDRYGNCTAIVDEKLHRREYTYDSYRRCTSHTEYINAPGVASRRWDWLYDRVVDFGDGYPHGFAPSAHTSKEWRVQVEPAFNDNLERRMTARWFDVNHRVIREETGWIQPDGPITGQNWYVSPDWELHFFSYDENGQKSTYIDPRGRRTTYEYDQRNRLWKTSEYPGGGEVTNTPRVTEITYDAGGNKTQIEFPDGKTQQWPSADYTAFGQPRTFIDELNHTTNMEYWPWGPMKKLMHVITHRNKDAGGSEDQQTTFWWDGLGRTWFTYFPDQTFELSVYELGQLSAWRTRRTQTKRFSYDARGRETSHTWDGGAAPSVTRHWDEANRLTSIENSFAFIDYTYDDAGQVLTEGTKIAGSDGQTPTGNGVRKQISYTRYASGEVKDLTYPSGLTVHREYTARGQLHTAAWEAGSIEYTYLSDGKVDHQNYPSSGVATTFGYDGRGKISSVLHRKNSHDLARRTYWRDERDRITAWRRGGDNWWNQMEDGRGDRYEYDWEGQLKNADYRATIHDDGTATGAVRGDRLDLDELGNRQRANWIANRGAVNFVRRDNGLNQYLSWTPSAIYYDDNRGDEWVYPGNGVMMDQGYVTASFNALNQPVAIYSNFYFGTGNFVWFGFDPLGRCVKRWVGPDNPPNGPPISTNNSQTLYYYYDGWNLIQEGSSANNVARQYVHGSRVDEIVASKIQGLWSYHHYDAQGNCIMLTDTDGGIREQYEYDAFGYPYVRNASGGTPATIWGNRFLFTGREWLYDLRLYDFRNRIYQPELGRFLQPDPKQFDAGDYNLYRYCHNDPINKSDPTGEFAWVAIPVGIAVYALLTSPDIADAPTLDSIQNNPQPRTAGMLSMGQKIVTSSTAAKAGVGMTKSWVSKLLDKMTNKATSPKSPFKHIPKEAFGKTESAAAKTANDLVKKEPPSGPKPPPKLTDEQ